MGTLISMYGSIINKPFFECNLARFRESLWGRCSWLVWNTTLLFPIPHHALCVILQFLFLEAKCTFLHIDIVLGLWPVFGRWSVNKCVLQAEASASSGFKFVLLHFSFYHKKNFPCVLLPLQSETQSEHVDLGRWKWQWQNSVWNLHNLHIETEST